MGVLALTGPTAGWLLGKPGLLDGLHELLLGEDCWVKALCDKDFAEGAVRLSSTADCSVIAMWNVDYTTSAGDDSWGLIDLSTATGLAHRMDISREVLERSIYIVSQRSQGLLIDGAYIHRSWPNGTHTCIAGRGTEARHASIGYLERDVFADTYSLHVVGVTGPLSDLPGLANQTAGLTDAIGEQAMDARRLYLHSRSKPLLGVSMLKDFRQALSKYTGGGQRVGLLSSVNVTAGVAEIPAAEAFKTASWTYTEWTAPDSSLSVEQRHILTSQAMLQHPIRITGPAGSGKTLLMQLLAIRRLLFARTASVPVRVLYLVHNQKMAEMVQHRFSILLQTDSSLLSDDRILNVRTLSDYALDALELDAEHIIDPDAHAAKEFQIEVLEDALHDVFKAQPKTIGASKLFSEVTDNESLKRLFVRMVMAEISIGIKGHGLESDRKRYVESQRPLSRLHGVLDTQERAVIYDIFRNYHETIFDGYNVLDSDDVALSLLGRLRTPIWQLKRREQGYDHIFVDETQLFNENERKVFPLLTVGTAPFVPVVLALDEAQEIYGQTTAGMATLGMENVAIESLSAIHRSSRPIVDLAFFVIQRSTDLFGPDFPDFTSGPESGKVAVRNGALPTVEKASDPQQSYGRFVLKRIRGLRKANLWRIAVVCMAELYWQNLLDELRRSDLPLHVLEQRGERLPMGEPVVALARPDHIGGQEFDAVVMVGAEEGLLPPRVLDNEPLAAAVEQQALRELYLAITRARDELIVLLAHDSALTPILVEAQKAGLLVPKGPTPAGSD